MGSDEITRETVDAKRKPLRKWVIAMCEAHAHTGKCGPDCICQELLDELDPRRRVHWTRWKFKKH